MKVNKYNITKTFWSWQDVFDFQHIKCYVLMETLGPLWWLQLSTVINLHTWDQLVCLWKKRLCLELASPLNLFWSRRLLSPLTLCPFSIIHQIRLVSLINIHYNMIKDKHWISHKSWNKKKNFLVDVTLLSSFSLFLWKCWLTSLLLS